jgi:predicted acyl esterase
MKSPALDLTPFRQALASLEDGLDVVDWASTSPESQSHIADHSVKISGW